MNVTKTHNIDSSEQDENGRYDYYYEYDHYEFSSGREVIYAKSYVQEPDVVSITRIRQVSGKLDTNIDSELLKLFYEAVTYLKGEEKTHFMVYCSDNGYYKGICI